MNTLVVGIGECGRNIALQLYYQFSTVQYIRYKFLMKNFYFFLTDSESTTSLFEDIKNKGIPMEVVNPDKTDIQTKPLNIFMLSPISSKAGVGGTWILSSKMAEEYFKKGGWEKEGYRNYINDLNDSSKFVECFNIFNSAGGGTGCGAGPVFLEYLNTMSKKDAPRTLYTATIVFPFKNEERWREVNSAVNIARYSRLCDGLLIADNEHMKNWLKLDTKNVQKKSNELMGNIWMWMSACSSTNFSISPKRWEASDFKRKFRIGTYGAPVVLCYREEPVETLKMIKMEWIVFRTINENCMAQCLPGTSRRILMIISKPENFESSSSESSIVDYIGKELKISKKSDIEVIFIKRKDNMKHVTFIALLVAPVIQRFEKLENNFKEYLEDHELFERDMLVTGLSGDEILGAYQQEYNNFKKYSDYLRRGSE